MRVYLRRAGAKSDDRRGGRRNVIFEFLKMLMYLISQTKNFLLLSLCDLIASYSKMYADYIHENSSLLSYLKIIASKHASFLMRSNIFFIFYTVCIIYS